MRSQRTTSLPTRPGSLWCTLMASSRSSRRSNSCGSENRGRRPRCPAPKVACRCGRAGKFESVGLTPAVFISTDCQSIWVAFRGADLQLLQRKINRRGDIRGPRYLAHPFVKNLFVVFDADHHAHSVCSQSDLAFGMGSDFHPTVNRRRSDTELSGTIGADGTRRNLHLHPGRGSSAEPHPHARLYGVRSKRRKRQQILGLTRRRPHTRFDDLSMLR